MGIWPLLYVGRKFDFIQGIELGSGLPIGEEGCPDGLLATPQLRFLPGRLGLPHPISARVEDRGNLYEAREKYGGPCGGIDGWLGAR